MIDKGQQIMQHTTEVTHEAARGTTRLDRAFDQRFQAINRRASGWAPDALYFARSGDYSIT